MGNRFASGKRSIGICDRCGQQFKLKQLRPQVIKQKLYDIRVCPSCFDPDHPQLMLGTFPVDDPQAVRNPRRDITYTQSGLLANGSYGGGSRVYQWGWNPVGGASSFDAVLTPNYLTAVGEVGIVTVTVT